jgi:hypothetical protein
MKNISTRQSITIITSIALAGCIAGCASSGEKANASSAAATTAPASSAPAPKAASAPGQVASRYKADDGRTIEIGKRTSGDGGWVFKNPHLDKCWVADGFNFTGYDVLYIAPTLSTAKLHNDQEEHPHQLAKENLQIELERALRGRGIFPAIALRESDIKPGARVLKLENTIVEYAKGGGGARYFAGLYGGGQPILRVNGKMNGDAKPVFTFEGRRSGVSAGAHMSGAFMKDEDIQAEDIRSLSLDLADFMSAIAGKFPPK